MGYNAAVATSGYFGGTFSSAGPTQGPTQKWFRCNLRLWDCAALQERESDRKHDGRQKQTLKKYLLAIVTWLGCVIPRLSLAYVCVYRWMLTVGRLATIYSHYLPVCLCWADPVCLSSAPTLPWYRSWACPLLHFSLVRKWDVAEGERGEGERKRKRRFSLQLLSVADTSAAEKASRRSEPRHFLLTRSGLIPGEKHRRVSARLEAKTDGERGPMGEEYREAGASSYILMTQAAAPSIPVPWHCRDMAWWHTRAVWMLSTAAHLTTRHGSAYQCWQGHPSFCPGVTAHTRTLTDTADTPT